MFVCTKDFEKRIVKMAKIGDGIGDDDLKAGNTQETYRTFVKFMRVSIGVLQHIISCGNYTDHGIT